MQLQTASTTTMAYNSIPLPASPTLTNPDMILPYGEYDSSPSPTGKLYQSAPSPEDWSIDDMQFSIGNAHTLPITPTTPIIYGNGTMLSDIGEVTEAESTPARKLPGPAERRLLKQAHHAHHGHNTPAKSSPTTGYNAGIKRAKGANHQRKTSIESTSTVTSRGEPVELFKDFDDDGISVDDSVFLGDDEGSVADSYSEQLIASETMRLSRKDDIVSPEEDNSSSAALSRRAEQILLNAKKRLNNMEGNLTRARSSLFITPSSSLSSIHSSSPLSRLTPSPTQPQVQAQLGVPPSRHRQLHTPIDSPATSPGHSRVYSENSITSPIRTPPFPIPFPVRSSSAAARYISKDGFKKAAQPSPPLSAGHVKEVKRISPPRGSLAASLLRKSSPVPGTPLQPLDENNVIPDSELENAAMQSMMDEHFGIDGDHRLTRSTSTMQMRDLRDQMHDLKGRLSVLRDRARDDTMKRRSLQSLRTPSPFTAAEQWYATSPVYGEGLSADAGFAEKAEAGDQMEVVEEEVLQARPEDAEDAESDVTSIYEDVVESHHDNNVSSVEPESAIQDEEQGDEPENYDTALEEDIVGETDDFGDEYNDEMVDHDELDDYESDASLYHDTVPAQLSHEDREDAFDYEHFFLHSAMGTISQQRRRRGSSGSCSSEDSVETARGPAVPAERDSRIAMGHRRSESSDTVSTVVTFATAKSQSIDEYEDEQELPDNFAVQHINSQSRPQSTPLQVKRSTFGSAPVNALAGQRDFPEAETRSNTDIFNMSLRDGSNVHRPSVSSLDSLSSNGTTRSFPLVNKPRYHPTSTSSTPDLRSREHAGSILSDSATLTEGINGERKESPVQMLAREDQVLVEKLVASLGQCVLGLQETGRTSYESRVWRRRLDAARRVLEGEEGAI